MHSPNERLLARYIPLGVEAARETLVALAGLPLTVEVGQAVNGALRKVILASSGSPRVRRLAAKHGLRLGASRFVAGEDLDACVAVLRGLNERGLHANTTLLGEDVLDEAETRAVADEYLTILSACTTRSCAANVALKLTHLGLDIDEELAFENVRAVVERAAELGNFIRIDMEYSALVDPTLRIYRRLREAGLDNVGTVLQSYLYRTPTTSRACSRSRRTSGSSRAPTSSRSRSPTRGRRTSTPPTSAWSSARSPAAATRRSPRTTSA